MLTVPVAIAMASRPRTAARARLTTTMIRRRSSRSTTHAGHAPEHQRRQELAEERERDEERVAGLARDQQRPRREHDAVADIREHRRGPQPAEARPESRGQHDTNDRRDGIGHWARQPIAATPNNRWVRPAARPSGRMDAVRVWPRDRALRRRHRWTQGPARVARSSVRHPEISRLERGGARHRTSRVQTDRVIEAARSPSALFASSGRARSSTAFSTAITRDSSTSCSGSSRGMAGLPSPRRHSTCSGERGSIDILAWHPLTRVLLVIEIKSVVPDIQATLAGLDRKVRPRSAIGEERGLAADARCPAPGARRRTGPRGGGSPRSQRRSPCPAGPDGGGQALAPRAIGPLAGILFLPNLPHAQPRQRSRTGLHEAAATARRCTIGSTGRLCVEERRAPERQNARTGPPQRDDSAVVGGERASRSRSDLLELALDGVVRRSRVGATGAGAGAGRLALGRYRRAGRRPRRSRRSVPSGPGWPGPSIGLAAW